MFLPRSAHTTTLITIAIKLMTETDSTQVPVARYFHGKDSMRRGFLSFYLRLKIECEALNNTSSFHEVQNLVLRMSWSR